MKTQTYRCWGEQLVKTGKQSKEAKWKYKSNEVETTFPKQEGGDAEKNRTRLEDRRGGQVNMYQVKPMRVIEEEKKTGKRTTTRQDTWGGTFKIKQETDRNSNTTKQKAPKQIAAQQKQPAEQPAICFPVHNKYWPNLK